MGDLVGCMLWCLLGVSWSVLAEPVSSLTHLAYCASDLSLESCGSKSTADLSSCLLINLPVSPAVSVWSEAGEEHFSSVWPCREGGSAPFSGCTETLWAGAVPAAAVGVGAWGVCTEQQL